MPKKFENVYQFKITLKDIKPTIWRRIQVPENYTFWDLHVAIQDAMGWYDCHLHEFSFNSPLGKGNRVCIGIPHEDYSDKVHEDWNVMIAVIFAIVDEVEYWYDFGDSWMHSIKLEKILPRESKKKYPVCIAGERACPPEDVGSEPGYYHLLEVLKNPRKREYKEFKEWLGKEYDPEYFNSEDVVFENPKERFKLLEFD